MLNLVEPKFYREQAAKLLLMMSQAVQMHERLTLRQLAYAEARESVESVLERGCDYLSLEEQYNMCQEFEGRLKTRCQGLLEVYYEGFPRRERPDVQLYHKIGWNSIGSDITYRSSEVQKMQGTYVRFTHQSVQDFLSTGIARALLDKNLQGQAFIPSLRLLEACLCHLKNIKLDLEQLSTIPHLDTENKAILELRQSG